MTEEKRPLNEGYQPQTIEKGYQPAAPTLPAHDPPPQGGYQPTSQGDNPANIPAPPGDE